MKMMFNYVVYIFLLLNFKESFAHLSDEEHKPIGLHSRSKRHFLGLSRKYKLNKRYQECTAPGDVKGHCKHINFCPMNVLGNEKNILEYLCIIEKSHVGVCCPDDIALSGLTGSQIIMDLPGGGYDYDKKDNTTGCGLPIEGKKSSNMPEWPWMAALYRPQQLADGLEQQFCGGALITDRHILTAAHCTRGFKATDIHVRLGEYDFGKSNETRTIDYTISEIIEHENFVLASYENDIAIIRLNNATSFNSYIWPICLPPSNLEYDNKTAFVAGWGQQYFAGPVSEVLLQVAVPIWPHQKCVDSFVQRITEDNICAASYEGGKDSCQGDSGGPLMMQLENDRWISIGIVSWGIGCGVKDSPGVYTKVANYLPWIIKNTMT